MKRFMSDEGSSSGFADLFAPPTEILFAGNTLDDAKKVGQEQCRHIVVNVQDVEEFASMTLNRDTWSDRKLKNLLKDKFVFCQCFQSSDFGREIQMLYPGHKNPSVHILDPRTGELLHSWSSIKPIGGLPAKQVIAKLEEIIKQVSLKPKRIREQEPVFSVGGDSEEDSALAAAIAASLQESPAKKPSKRAKVDEEKVEVHSLVSSPEESLPANGSQGTESKVNWAELYKDEPKEPELGVVGAMKLRIKLPDNSVCTRRFLLKDKVQCLHDFIRWKVKETHTRDYEIGLSYPAKILEDASLTLEDEKLRGAQVFVNWIGADEE